MHYSCIKLKKKGFTFLKIKVLAYLCSPKLKIYYLIQITSVKNMNHYEVTFIIDPVLSGDEIKSTANTYEALLKDQGCSIVHVHEIGLKQLAYPINKKSSGIYYCIEFTSIDGTIIGKLELSLRRDERIMRFLTVRLDKYGIKYNEDRRTGKISAYRKKEAKKKPSDAQSAPVARQEVKAPAPAPVVAAPVVVNEEE